MKCSTFGCVDALTKQCNSCNGALLCKKCCYTHFSKHLNENNQCVFGKIKIELSKAQKQD